MKNYSLGWRQKATDFDGQQICYEIKPLNLEAWLLLQPFLNMDGEEVKLIGTAIGLQKLTNDIFPDAVRNISGFMIDNENPTIEQITNNIAFMSLVSNILIELINISSLNEEESKNSEGLSISPHSAKLNLNS